MAAPIKNIRFPEPLVAAVERAAAANERSFSAEVLATLADRYLGEGASDAAPRRAAPAVSVPKGERDTAPRLKDAETAGEARGGGIVSGLSLPVGNTRPPLQRGAGKAKGGR